MSENKSMESKLTVNNIQDFMTLLLPLPRFWLFILVFAIILSMFEVTLNADGAVTAMFRLSTITAILVALIWLPILLGVIALAGGGFKTPAGEVSTPGLLDLLVNVAATMDIVEENLPPDQKEMMLEVREKVELQVASLSPGAKEARTRLKQLAKEYEDLRLSEPPGRSRTYHMTSLVA